MRSALKFVVTVVLALALQGCTAMLLGGNGSSETTSRDTRNSAQQTADSRISGSIRSQFNAEPLLNGSTIGIRTVSGRVTLTGTIGSYEGRDKAASIAGNTSGVNSVDTRIVVNTNL
jgi:osmotically-inducible protein OsmY